MDAIPKKDHYGLSIAAMILGIISLFAWFIPFCGLPISITGLVLGIIGRESSKKGMAIAGIVMSVIGLVLGIVNASIGAYMGAMGTHPLFNWNN